MRYHALASDYDGTLARHGTVDEEVLAGLVRLRASGRRIILVTGRRLDDLQSVCPDLSPFEVIVAENGALLYWPETRELRPLGEPPPALFIEALRARGVLDVAQGHVIVATWQPHETVVLEVIRELGLEMQVIFNKGAVMILPSGVNKATGLRAALEALRLSPHNVVGIGDAENDHALLAACECGAAVSNALPMLRERADLVTAGDHGDGVLELAERLMKNDLADLTPALSRHDIEVGVDAAGGAMVLPAFGITVLLAGTSGGGKSTLTGAFLEKLEELSYQYCLFDPEGDFDDLAGAVVMGTNAEKPAVEQLVKVLDHPGHNVVVNLLALAMDDRPRFFDEALARVQLERARSGHPHWVVIDEAHHLAPSARREPAVPGGDLKNLFMITVHPGHVSSALLSAVDVLIVVGATPQDTVRDFAAAIGVAPPDVQAGPLGSGEAIVWWPGHGAGATWMRSLLPQTLRRRHARKYAEGELPPERSFYFRGPQGKLHLRAHNLAAFLQLGDGVDDETWWHHLRAGDYSAWLNSAIKDRELADEVAAIERAGSGSGSLAGPAVAVAAAASRRAIRGIIERRYSGAA